MIDNEKILEEYKRQELIGGKDIEAGKLTQKELNRNLKGGVCVELMRIWMGSGIGKKSLKLRDAKNIKDQKGKRDFIKSMLNMVEWHWIELSQELNDSKAGDFRDYLSEHHRKLYDIWVI